MPGYKIGTVNINYQSPQPGIRGGKAVSIKTDDEELLNAAKTHELVIEWDEGFDDGETHLFVRGDVDEAKEAIQQRLNEIINKRR